MKKKLLSAFLVLTMLSCQNVLVHADSLAHLEADEGNLDVVGYEVKEDENLIFIILEFNNTTSESCAPMFQFNVTAYQDGVELDTSYSRYDPEGCKDSSTKIKPGATLKFSKCYELSGTSPVDIELEPLFNFDNLKAECTLNLSDDVSPDSDPDYKALYEELQKQFDELQKKYDELLLTQQQS